MLGAHMEAEPPTDTGCPEDPLAGADPQETAELPRADSGAAEVLRLRRQVAGLRQQLQTQQAHWAAVLRDLQTQMDALKEQAPRPLGPDASTSVASARPRRHTDTPAAKPACGRGSPPSAGEDTTRKHAARSRSAPLLGRALSPRSAPSSQNLPVEPASSPGTARPTGTGTEKEGGARRPAGQVGETRGAGCKDAADEGLRTTIVRFSNGDVKKTLPDQRVVRAAADPPEKQRSRPVHYCASTGTTRTVHPSGLEVVRFPDKRTEKFHPDGSKEVLFPDGTVTRLHDGQEETVFPDGTSVSVARNGDKTIVFSNGQRDIHTAEFKRREYPDGTVRTVYCDGRQETRDASGRVKVRDEARNRVLDWK
uniref:Centromere protein J C-terminal domain-containing protein n=1 Tax=Myotis myotis TaxID=51298 RepID=A0A7J7WW62_MYOMY|nr:hypothetical protein mMyoMyo1_011862 [Myotis myotis]